MSVTPEEIRRQLTIARIQQQLKVKEPSALATGINSAARSFNNAALGVPRFVGDALAGMAATADSVGNLVASPIHGSDGMSFRERFDSARESGPVRFLRSDAMNPTATDAEAAIKAIPALMPGGETPGESFNRHTDSIEDQIQREQEAHPLAATVGDVTGNIGAVVAGRRPFARQIKDGEQALNPSTPDLFFGSAPASTAARSTTEMVLERAIQSPAMRRLARGFGRAIETGTEAAFLESVNRGDDPLMMASIAAGGQMAGSSFLEMSKNLVKKNLGGTAMNLTAAAFATGGMMQLMKSGTPGGEDFILPSLETGFDKVLFGLALSAASAATGAGRPFRANQSELSNRLVNLADAIATVPRAGTLTLLTSLNDAAPEDQARFAVVNEKIIEDPLYFGRHSSERIARAYRNGTVLREIDRMMRNDQFADRVRALEVTE